MQVLEGGGVGVGKIEWHVGETIVDTVQLFSSQEVVQIVLNDWGLSNNSMLSSGGWNINAITEGENVLKS